MKDLPVIIIHHFDTSPSTLWEAITERDLMVEWFFNNIPSFEARVGFKTNFIVENEGRVFPHFWEIIEVIPGVKIVYDWRYAGYIGSSIVTFEIEEKKKGCTLFVTHANIDPYDQSIPEFTRESCEGGWEYFIKDRLSNFLKSKTNL